MEKPKKFKKFNPKFSKNHLVQKEPVHVFKPIKDNNEKAKRIADVFQFYLPGESYEEYSNFNDKMKAINCFLVKANYCLKSVFESKSFRVDMSNISKDKEFLSYWPEFSQDLINKPTLVIGLFGFAMEQFTMKNYVKDIEEEYGSESTSDSGVMPSKFNPRFIGRQNYLPFQDLKLHNYGKFVSLIGTVVRVSDVKPFCTYMAFSCIKCQSVQAVFQNKGCYTVPNNCIGENCLGRAFKPLLNSRLTWTIPRKTIRLQELNMDHNDGGRVPRTVECELTCDLTNFCMPGDSVVISGTVVTSPGGERETAGQDASSYVLSISANSVVCLKGKNADNLDSSGCSELKPEDLNAIQKIHSEKNLFRLIVASLCPNIYGHELIKAGLILGLFGGRDRSQKEGDENEYCIRENSHILIVGDPGLGKSQMLLACANVSPRGVYVCGNSTTSSGLTVTISKDGGKDNSLEAGALVLADQGHCCIDEFDKMMHQHSALLEAMEQQTISIAKSGVVCSLPARTSILAAANPTGGHYNRAKTVSENLRIGGSLLSRFDLVFIVEDVHNYDIDDQMSKHVMGLCTSSQQREAENPRGSFFPETESESKSLLERLQLEPHEKRNLIPPAVLQKYISYARKFARPKLTPEVCETLKNFYINMRKQHRLSSSIPITTRQLESLIRLTEARARTELRSFCTKSDAEDVIEIMKYSMHETYSDEHGNLDFDRSIHGSGMSKASQAKKLIKAMTSAASVKGDDCFTLSEIEQLCKKMNISSDSVYSLIASLNDQGFLLKKGYQLYKLLIS